MKVLAIVRTPTEILATREMNNLELKDNRLSFDIYYRSATDRLRIDIEILDVDTLATLSTRVRALEERLP